MANENSGASSPVSRKNSHAHFQIPEDKDCDGLAAHDSEILVEKISESKMNVRLGFLQIKHIYEVRFSIQDELGPDIVFDPLENLNAKIESVNSKDDGNGHEIVLTFNAAKEKIVRESVTICSQLHDQEKLTLTLHARVLGKGKGTPSLKKGIHCLRIEWDEESDASDWQGF